MKIKFIYFDLDNTLNSKAKGMEDISELLLKKLKKLIINNIRIGIATTRGLIRTKDIIGQIPTLPLIILNGGQIYLPNNKLVKSNPLNFREKKLTLILIKQNLSYIKYAAFYPEKSCYGKIFSKNQLIKNTFKTKYKHTLQNPESVTENFDTFESWLLNSNTSMIEFSSKVSINNLNYSLNISYDGINYINASRINKGSAIQYVCKKLGINPSNLLVVGDSYTDIPMFRINGVTSLSVGKNQLNTDYNIKSPKELDLFLSKFFKL